MTVKEKFLGFIGILRKNSSVIWGYHTVLNEHKRKFLICTAEDTGESVKKKMKILAEKDKAEYIEVCNKEELGKYTNRKEISVFAVLESKLAASLKKKIYELNKANERSGV